MDVVMICYTGTQPPCSTCDRGLSESVPRADVLLRQLSEENVCCGLSSLWGRTHGCPWPPRRERTPRTSCEFDGLVCFKSDLLETLGTDTLPECSTFSIHCWVFFPCLSKIQTHCVGLDWTERAEVFGRKTWNENSRISTSPWGQIWSHKVDTRSVLNGFWRV